MNENERKPVNDAALDEALKLMAEEVPPMPADFHEKWMNAVRAEAQQQAAEAPAAKKEGRLARINRWNRILSVAAVFVFLIGGVAIYRASRKQETAPEAVMQNAAFSVSMTSEPEAKQDPAEVRTGAGEPEPAPENRMHDEDTVSGAVQADNAEQADAAAEGASYEGAAYEDAAVQMSASASMKKAEEPAMAAEEADMEDAEGEYAEEAAEAAPASVKSDAADGKELMERLARLDREWLPDWARDVFSKATSGLKGCNYIPIALVTLQQQEDGQDCGFLAELTPVVLNPQTTYALIHIHVDKQGNAEITGSEDVELPEKPVPPAGR